MKCPSHEHVSRRAMLKGALGAAAGGAVMNWGALTQSAENAGQAAKSGKRCILIWLNGGASQFETFDMKPQSENSGPFRPISTNLSGVQICELMPKMSQMMDKLCVIRSMRTSEIDHPGGIYLMHTGYRPAANMRFPEIGAIAAKYLGTESSDLPSFIKISSNGDAGGGFLGPKYQPFNLNHDGKLPTFARNNMDPARELRRHELRDFVEDVYARQREAETARMHREAYAAARRLQGALGAFDYEQEWPKFEQLYGDSLIGRGCMMARKLVEAGVPFVEVGQSGYDTHADNFTGHKGLVPCMEHAWAGLITDLEDRGLLDDTLIIWMGEIGRTPRINNRAGRDHYVRAWTTALAGGGVKGGMVYGETDADGVDVADNPVTEGDFFATVYTTLGIDPRAENYQGSRPIPLAPFGSKVVKDLLV
ncbi:MAG: DUF1501 domain-containing protein [Planctomycetales bacterium]|nr:DUF1501 domain-containing protein [Planctomycetales bacterium]